MKGGTSNLFVTVPADIDPWFKAEYTCCIELPK
jgi:hypothetical protein